LNDDKPKIRTSVNPSGSHERWIFRIEARDQSLDLDLRSEINFELISLQQNLVSVEGIAAYIILLTSRE
jgi:hypothetical protein